MPPHPTEQLLCTVRGLFLYVGNETITQGGDFFAQPQNSQHATVRYNPMLSASFGLAMRFLRSIAAGK